MFVRCIRNEHAPREHTSRVCITSTYSPHIHLHQRSRWWNSRYPNQTACPKKRPNGASNENTLPQKQKRDQSGNKSSKHHRQSTSSLSLAKCVKKSCFTLTQILNSQPTSDGSPVVYAKLNLVVPRDACTNSSI